MNVSNRLDDASNRPENTSNWPKNDSNRPGLVSEDVSNSIMERGIDIREGVLDNMAAVLDPAFRTVETEQRSIYQVRMDILITYLLLILYWNVSRKRENIVLMYSFSLVISFLGGSIYCKSHLFLH